MAAAMVVVVVTGTPARGGNWPTPAAGPSASGQPELLLTFDDGPNRNTERVLATLHEHHAQALFFWVGNMLTHGNPGMVQRITAQMLADGHVIANHTQTHAQLCQVAPEVAEREIDTARTAIEAATGMHAEWFRTPYGSKCPRLEGMLAIRRLVHFHWDIDPQEWADHNPIHAMTYVMGRLRRLTGRAVLLMHDIHPVTARALPMIFEALAAENAARRSDGRPEILLVTPSQIAAEQTAPGLLQWLHDTATAAVDRLAAAGAAVP